MKQNVLSSTIDLCRQRICDVAYSRMIVKGVMLWLVFSAFLFVLVSGHLCFASDASADTAIYSKLIKLKPLPKPHYSWGLGPEFLNDPNNNEKLYELARITHTICIKGEWVTEAQIDKCVYVCAKANMLKPSIPSSIGINYSPWHIKFGKDLPPTDRGATYFDEISFFVKRLNFIKSWVKAKNAYYKSNVEVGALLLDCERFHEKPNDVAWNKGMQEALDAIHKAGQEIFPEARIEWYGRGVAQTASTGNGWVKSPLFTGNEIKPSLSCEFYSIPELDKMREGYRRTAQLAQQMGVNDVTPWVALASGYRKGLMKPYYWDSSWDYDLIYSYQLGAEMNIDWYATFPEIYAPCNRAKVIVFYPSPFHEKYPDWPKHFIAYVRGATGVKYLSDLGYREENEK
jgi:hypothetical protein